MPETTTADRASTEDAAALKRRGEKIGLVREICILNTRIDALKKLVEKRAARLELLMSADGDRALTDKYGSGHFKAKARTVQVHNRKALTKLFSKDILAEHFSPPIAFIDACEREKKDISSAITVGKGESFEVRRAQTKEAKKRQQEMIESTQRETEAAIVAIMKRLAKDNPED